MVFYGGLLYFNENMLHAFCCRHSSQISNKDIISSIKVGHKSEVCGTKCCTEQSTAQLEWDHI